MNGKIVTFCSVLVFVVLIKTRSSSGILCHGKTHLCYEVPRENCTCVPFTMKCPPENMVIECPKGGNQNCQMIRGRESSCRCVCDAQ
uniref:Dermacentor 9 kDa family member n=1 Tax=Rhipicephalus appendiculatus TaxID=34631 RepID=A0A131Z4C1_RHIAP